jgi:Arc/MetJ family transcription regulator
MLPYSLFVRHVATRASLDTEHHSRQPSDRSVGTAIQVAIYRTSSAQKRTPISQEMVYALCMGRTNIEIDETLVRKARKLTRLKTKREIVDKALELLVRSESRKGILRYYGTGIWKGDVKAMRRNRG